MAQRVFDPRDKRYTVALRNKIGAYFNSHRNIRDVQRRCLRDPAFQGRRPNRRTIRNCFLKFESGNLGNAPAGRPTMSARSEENLLILYGFVMERRSRSIYALWRLMRTLDRHMSQVSIYRALTVDLRLKAFKFCRRQDLRLEDFQERVDYATHMLALDLVSPTFFSCVIMVDEAPYYLNVRYDAQNLRYWAHENEFERLIYERMTAKVMVFAGLIGSALLGPYFFEGTVNGQTYFDMLIDQFLPDVQAHVMAIGGHWEDYWFFHDCAPAHRARGVVALLQAEFPGRLIARTGGDIRAPARSPDLARPDTFLWGYSKALVYQEGHWRAANIEQLIERIHDSFDAIREREPQRHSIARSIDDFRERLHKVIEIDGGPL